MKGVWEPLKDLEPSTREGVTGTQWLLQGKSMNSEMGGQRKKSDTHRSLNW